MNENGKVEVEAKPKENLSFVKWSDGSTSAKRKISYNDNQYLVSYFDCSKCEPKKVNIPVFTAGSTTQSSYKSQLDSLGLLYSVSYQASGATSSNNGTIASVNPAVGSSAVVGSTVTVYVYKYEETVTPTLAPTVSPTEGPHEHVWVEHYRQEATCDSDGYVSYKCSSCGDTYTETLSMLTYGCAVITPDSYYEEDNTSGDY